jgi:hypothetical protein
MRSSVAAPDTPVATNCLQEFVDILGRYIVFNDNQPQSGFPLFLVTGGFSLAAYASQFLESSSD